MTSALKGRDRWRLEELLRDAPDGSIALAIFCGQYVAAGRSLAAYETDLARRCSEEHEELRRQYADAISDAALLAETYGSTGIDASHKRKMQAAASLRERLPTLDVPGAAEIAAEVQSLLSDSGENPLSTRDRLEALGAGLRRALLPAPLREVALKIRKRISAGVWRRVREQAGPPSAPGSEEDLWRLYHVPFRALDPLRQSLPYEQFLHRVETVLGAWAVRRGATHVQYQRLLARMGLHERQHEVHAEDELATLLREQGALLARVCWWEEDTRHEQTIVLVGVEGDAPGRRFVAVDGPRCSAADLDALDACLVGLEADGRALAAWIDSPQ